MSFPKQTATQDQVKAADIRASLNAGVEWDSTLAGTAPGAVTSSTTYSLSALTDATTGTISTGLGTISSTPTAAEVRNSLATLANKVNLILALLRNLKS